MKVASIFPSTFMHGRIDGCASDKFLTPRLGISAASAAGTQEQGTIAGHCTQELDNISLGAATT